MEVKINTNCERISNKLHYSINAVYSMALIDTFGKYFTSILNDGEGGSINLSITRGEKHCCMKHTNIGDVARGHIQTEISKITPFVPESDYNIKLIFNQHGSSEITVYVEPVPWGPEEYAAPDGHVYTSNLGDNSQEFEDTDENIFRENENQCKAKIGCDMELSESLETAGVIQETDTKAFGNLPYMDEDCLRDMREKKLSESFETAGVIQETDTKEFGTLPYEMRSMVRDCVRDLRELKAMAGIRNTSAHVVEKKTVNVIPEENKMPDRHFHHSKSMSESITIRKNSPLRQRKSESLSDIKSFCEDVEFEPCREVVDWPGTRGKLIQVDGEGDETIGYTDGICKATYSLPQLDGTYDICGTMATTVTPEETMMPNGRLDHSKSMSESFNINKKKPLQLMKLDLISEDIILKVKIDFAVQRMNPPYYCVPRMDMQNRVHSFEGFTSYEHDLTSLLTCDKKVLIKGLQRLNGFVNGYDYDSGTRISIFHLQAAEEDGMSMYSKEKVKHRKIREVLLQFTEGFITTSEDIPTHVTTSLQGIIFSHRNTGLITLTGMYELSSRAATVVYIVDAEVQNIIQI